MHVWMSPLYRSEGSNFRQTIFGHFSNLAPSLVECIITIVTHTANNADKERQSNLNLPRDVHCLNNATFYKFIYSVIKRSEKKNIGTLTTYRKHLYFLNLNHTIPRNVIIYLNIHKHHSQLCLLFLCKM